MEGGNSSTTQGQGRVSTYGAVGVTSKVNKATDWCPMMVVIPNEGKVCIYVDLNKHENLQLEWHMAWTALVEQTLTHAAWEIQSVLQAGY